MILLVARGLFLVMSAAVAVLYAIQAFQDPAKLLAATFSAVAISGAFVTLDVLTPQKKLAAISGVFVGLIVGMIAAYALSFLVEFTATLYGIGPTLKEGVTVFLGVLCVFAAITLVLQTKDQFRFLLPYVEFTKQLRGPRPVVLDTSALIDGRIFDMVQTHVLQGLLVLPRFVLNELQAVADASDRLKRARGRRGLEILNKLRNSEYVDVQIEDMEGEGSSVDQKLLAVTRDLPGRLVTTDYNLEKVAKVRGIEVINVNALAEALRPVVLPGEHLRLTISKPGESAGQGVGYLADGSMVVVEHARNHIGEQVELEVTSTLQTSAGRMLFGRLAKGAGTNNERTPNPTTASG